MENVLVLVRHGQSEWNEKNLFTGWRDPGLTELGIREATRAGKLLKERDLKFDIAFTSVLKRANHTLELMLSELGQGDLKTIRNQALNERDYGDLAGLNKADAAEKWGKEQIHEWRRSYDVRPPGGESLKDTGDRVVPYYTSEIWPLLKTGRNVVIAAHGNSLRALIKHLQDFTPEEILAQEVATGVPIVYRLNEDGSVMDRQDLDNGS
ncbi:MAG: 2,3-bisphosphoglycerate-dependent phosphoglycerate mutase [Hyphomicrobiaceae bacterium]